MPPDSDSTNSQAPDDSVAMLHGLDMEPTSDLPQRVRLGIERRFLGRDLIGFYWTATAQLAIEWLSALLSRLGARHPSEGER